MVSELLRRIIPGRSYWGVAPFSEMSELYAARFLRMVSQNMVGVFVAVFIYQKGYSLASIMVIIGVYYILRAIISFFSAYYIAWVSPKRAILVSNIFAIPALVALTTIDEFTFASVVVFFVCQAFAITIYTIASDMQFSSLKSDEAGGRELGVLHIMEKVGTGVAPMIGGFVAYWFGPEYTMWVAAILSIVSAFPLFMTPEKIRRKQRVMYRGMPWSQLRPQFFSYSILGADQVVSGATWSLFAAIAVFSITSNAVYAELGVAFSVSLIVSVIVSHIFGKVIDKRRGRELMLSGILMNSAVHISRCFISTPAGVITTNATNEIGTSAYQMPYLRSYIDTADNLPGYRVAYISMMSVFFCVGAALLSFITAAAVVWLGMLYGLMTSFVCMAIATYGVYWSGFDALRRQA